MTGNQIRNGDWMQDQTLKNDLSRYVRKKLETSEILDFIESKYPMYAWSGRTLARRLQYFDIKFTDYEVDIEDVKEALLHFRRLTGSLLCNGRTKKWFHGFLRLPIFQKSDMNDLRSVFDLTFMHVRGPAFARDNITFAICTKMRLTGILDILKSWFFVEWHDG